MQTFDYAPPPASTNPKRPLIVFALTGLAPTSLLFVTFSHWAVTGDPIDSLEAFKAYHYVSAAIVIALVGWFVMTCWRAPRRWRALVCVAALVWVFLNLLWVRAFVREVRADDPSGYFQGLWNAE